MGSSANSGDAVQRLISVVTPCYNEEGNVQELYERVCAAFEQLPGYTFEHIFIDNASRDKTVEILKNIARNDKRVKIIVNTRNFGVNRSPLHAYFQTTGEAMIALVADLQDPPELIPQFVRKWEEGYKVVAAIKKETKDSLVMGLTRKLYYEIVTYLSETTLIKNFNGFGLYDQSIIQLIKNLHDNDPYMRGLVSETGYEIARIEYSQSARKSGRSKNSLYDLYAQAMTGILSQSRLPLRLISFFGFIASLVTFLIGIAYSLYSLIFWDPTSSRLLIFLMIGLFFFVSLQMLALGIIGEYVGSIHARTYQKWLVIEKERINFDAS